jgi:hypothetical protein
MIRAVSLALLALLSGPVDYTSDVTVGIVDINDYEEPLPRCWPRCGDFYEPSPRPHGFYKNPYQEPVYRPTKGDLWWQSPYRREQYRRIEKYQDRYHY